jgi:hypothetical protein
MHPTSFTVIALVTAAFSPVTFVQAQPVNVSTSGQTANTSQGVEYSSLEMQSLEKRALRPYVSSLSIEHIN